MENGTTKLMDVTKTGNGERGTGNEFTAVTRLRIQHGGQRKRKGNNLGKCKGSVMVVNVSFYWLCPRAQYGIGINKA